MKQQSELLTDFYRTYLAWAEGKQLGFFTKKCGLCHNLAKYLNSTGCSHFYEDVISEMRDQFVNAGLDDIYPFNNGSGRDYDSEGKNDNMANNQTRMKWVRDHAQ